MRWQGEDGRHQRQWWRQWGGRGEEGATLVSATAAEAVTAPVVGRLSLVTMAMTAAAMTVAAAAMTATVEAVLMAVALMMMPE